jgi:hypothetical protein
MKGFEKTRVENVAWVKTLLYQFLVYELQLMRVERAVDMANKSLTGLSSDCTTAVGTKTVFVDHRTR